MPVAVTVQQHNSGYALDTVTAGLCGTACSGNIRRPNTFNYHLNNLTVVPSTGSTHHRICELRKQKYIYVNK
jgi:hypothetical protein